MLAVAETYFKGVSTRDFEAVIRELGIESLSSSQVSRAAKLLDEELESWQNRPLTESGLDQVNVGHRPRLLQRIAPPTSRAISQNG